MTLTRQTRKIGETVGTGIIQPGSAATNEAQTSSQGVEPIAAVSSAERERGTGESPVSPSADGPQGPWASTAGDQSGTHSRSRDYRDAGHVVARLQDSPLVEGEDRREYDALAREIHDAVQPKTIFDHIRVADLIHYLWEEGRYRQQRVALPHATRFKAAVVLLMPHTRNFEAHAGRTALDYLCGDPEARERARRFMHSVGITDAAIVAQAAELHGQSIAALDRLIGQSQTRRGTIIREVERDKRKAEKRKAKLKPAESTGTTH